MGPACYEWDAVWDMVLFVICNEHPRLEESTPDCRSKEVHSDAGMLARFTLSRREFRQCVLPFYPYGCPGARHVMDMNDDHPRHVPFSPPLPDLR